MSPPDRVYRFTSTGPFHQPSLCIWDKNLEIDLKRWRPYSGRESGIFSLIARLLKILFTNDMRLNGHHGHHGEHIYTGEVAGI